MYTLTNFPTKKALREAVEKFNTGTGPAVEYFQPGPFGGHETQNGTIFVEGPHYPKPHTWYAQCQVKDGHIIKVK